MRWLLVAALALAGCSLGDVDLSDKTCPCGSGWRCDELRNRCIRGDLFDGGVRADAGAREDAPIGRTDAGRDAARADSGLDSGPGTDAGPTADAGGEIDAGVLGPFGPATRVVELDITGGEDDPTLTADMLEIYFDSNSTGDGDVWMSTRSSIGSAWTAPVAVTELNSLVGETSPEIAGDGLLVYVTSNRGGDSDIYVATRPSRSDPWSAPTRVAELSSAAAYDWSPSLSSDGLTGYMASSRRGTEELFRTTRASRSAPWGAPVPLALPGTSMGDNDSCILPGELALLFSSVGRGSIGTDSSLYVATRAERGGPFTGVELLDGADLDTADEYDPWLSPDGRTLYFTSNRSGGSPIWMATR